MSDSFVEQSKEQQHVLERLVKGLPGIRDYTDKETRRDADYRVRQLIVDELSRTRDGLLDCQNRLLKQGGLAFLDDLDAVVGKVQNLADRVRTASYGYAGFFDTVRIGKEELNALYNFDVAMLSDVARMESAVTALRASLDDQAAIAAQIDQTDAAANEMTQLFERRARAIDSPALLAQADYAPPPADLPQADPSATSPTGDTTAQRAYPDAAPMPPAGEAPAAGD